MAVMGLFFLCRSIKLHARVVFPELRPVPDTSSNLGKIIFAGCSGMICLDDEQFSTGCNQHYGQQIP